MTKEFLLLFLVAVIALAASVYAPAAQAFVTPPFGLRPSPGPCAWGTFEVGLPFFEGETKGTSVCDFAGGATGNVAGPIGRVLQKVVTALGAFTIMAAVVSIVIGGYIYMTAGGSADRVRLAKVLIASALSGVMLALLAWLIIKTINPLLLQY